MNNYIIRKLNNSDYQKYLFLINQFRKTMFTFEEYKNILSKIENNSTIQIVEYNNELIGTAIIIYEYKFIRNIIKMTHIEDVCIDKEYRNKGICKLLIKRKML